MEESEGWLPDAKELLAAVDRVKPEALVVDYMLTGALCGAAATGLPTVVLIHTLYRALLAGRVPAPMGMAGGVEQLNAIRSELGLAGISDLGDLLDPATLLLVTAPEQLDAPGSGGDRVMYAGILLEPSSPSMDWPPPPGPDPLVVVNLGTAMSGGIERETLLLQNVADALSGLPVRAVFNLPKYIDQESLTAGPNVAITGYIPHTQLLPRADLLVTHAGLGSVCAALGAGTPMVCLPLDRDQPANADAVARIGAGLRLDPDCPVDELTAAVNGGLQWAPRVQIDPDPAQALDAMERAAT